MRRTRRGSWTRPGLVMVGVLAALGPILAIAHPAWAAPFRWEGDPDPYSRQECGKLPSTADSIHFDFLGGQSLSFGVHNTNILGLPVTVDWNNGGKDASTIIAPGQTRWVWMNVFGEEPIGNHWDLSTPAASRSYVWIVRSNRCNRLMWH